MRALLLLLSGTLAVAACTADPTASPESADASREDAATEDAHAIDAEVIARDGGGLDGGGLDGGGLDGGGLDADAGPVLACWPCEIEPCAPELCTDRTPLTAGAPRSGDTSLGGRGDCALSGSGTGGDNLYYSLQVGGARAAVVVLTPRSPVDHAGPMMRVFSDCAATEVEALNRLERDDGRLALCVQREDPTAPEREVVLTVSNYHEAHFTFDLALTHATDTSTVCEVWEWMRIP